MSKPTIVLVHGAFAESSSRNPVMDRNIPAAALGFMAQRAGSRKTVAVAGASHVVMLSHGTEVARLIDEAATAVS